MQPSNTFISHPYIEIACASLKDNVHVGQKRDSIDFTDWINISKANNIILKILPFAR